VGEQIGGITRKNHVHAFGGLSLRVVMVGHRLNDRVRQSPKAEQVGSDFGMRNVDELFLYLMQRHAFLYRLCQGARKMHRCAFEGQPLRMKNLATNEEVSCTVADINRTSDQVPKVGIAFAKPSPSFWRVAFPPEDWSPRSPEAKRVSYVTQAKPELANK
jgi:hypothetical protein